MTTEELRRMLELAARAQEIAGQAVGSSRLFVSDSGNVYDWLDDDGDSARMRSALGIGVAWEPDPSGEIHSLSHVHCMCWRIPHGRSERIADHNNDRDAALRLCALRVAAAIGEGME